LSGNSHVEDQTREERVRLRWVIEKWVWRVDLNGTGIGLFPVAGIEIGGVDFFGFYC
jgi:hypothetical protein